MGTGESWAERLIPTGVSLEKFSRLSHVVAQERGSCWKLSNILKMLLGKPWACVMTRPAPRGLVQESLRDTMLNSAHFGSWLTFWMLADSPARLVAAGDSFFRDLKYQNLKPAAGTAHWAVVGTWHLPCQLLLPAHLCPASMPVWFENSLPHSAKLIHREHEEDSGLLCTEASLLGRLSGS